MVVDESNVQMSSLMEQLDAAQQRLDVAETDVTALQATETNLQQQLRSTQVGSVASLMVLHRSGHKACISCISSLLCVHLEIACLQHRSSKSMPACSITAACACKVSRHTNTEAANNAKPKFIGATCTCMRPLTVTGCRPAALLLQEALDSSRQERESSDAEWDARHQEAVDSAEQWKAFADKLTKEKEVQQQQLASASSELQVELMRLLLRVERLRHLHSFSFDTLQSGVSPVTHHTSRPDSTGVLDMRLGSKLPCPSCVSAASYQMQGNVDKPLVHL